MGITIKLEFTEGVNGIQMVPHMSLNFLLNCAMAFQVSVKAFAKFFVDYDKIDKFSFNYFENCVFWIPHLNGVLIGKYFATVTKNCKLKANKKLFKLKNDATVLSNLGRLILSVLTFIWKCISKYCLFTIETLRVVKTSRYCPLPIRENM